MSEQAPWNAGTNDTPEVQEEAQTLAIQLPDEQKALATETEDSALVSTATRSYSTKADFKMEELLIPRLRLAQGQTPEVLSGEAKPGQWVLLGNEATDEIEVVIMAWGRARELRQRGGGEDDGKVLCRSADAVIGVGDPGGPCDTCPMSSWQDNPKTGRRMAPPCAQIYSYQVFDVTHGSMALLELKRTGLDAAKMINTMIATRGITNFVVKLSGQKREAGEGRAKFVFYAPAVSVAPISQELRETAQMFMPDTQ